MRALGSAALLAIATQAQSFQKTEFQANTLNKELNPPIWMIGEYYVVSQSSGDQYLYIIPTVYSKISEDSPFNPANGQIIQMYGQFETAPVTEDSEELVDYESWTCNMKYFTEIADLTKDKII